MRTSVVEIRVEQLPTQPDLPARVLAAPLALDWRDGSISSRRRQYRGQRLHHSSNLSPR